MEITVRVRVDGLNPLASDCDGQFVPRRLLGARAVQETAAAKEDAGCSRSGTSFDKITARRRDVSRAPIRRPIAGGILGDDARRSHSCSAPNLRLDLQVVQ
jgi:hypothetical protein